MKFGWFWRCLKYLTEVLFTINSTLSLWLKYNNNKCTVEPVSSGHSKTDKRKVLKTNGSLMKVESIAECSLGAFCNTFDLH